MKIVIEKEKLIFKSRPHYTVRVNGKIAGLPMCSKKEAMALVEYRLKNAKEDVEIEHISNAAPGGN